MAPGRTTPVAGSERMSERSSFSSMKYGPSVSAGRTMHDGSAVATADAVAAAVVAAALVCCAVAVGDGDASAPPGAHAARSATLDPPNSASTSLRLRMRPTCASSLSIDRLPLH